VHYVRSAAAAADGDLFPAIYRRARTHHVSQMLVMCELLIAISRIFLLLLLLLLLLLFLLFLLILLLLLFLLLLLLLHPFRVFLHRM